MKSFGEQLFKSRVDSDLFLFPSPEASLLPAVHPKDPGAQWGALRKDPAPPCDGHSDGGSFFGLSIHPCSKASNALERWCWH